MVRSACPSNSPINQRGLGYGENYLRGLEYYVIDGGDRPGQNNVEKDHLLLCTVPPLSKTLHPDTIYILCENLRRYRLCLITRRTPIMISTTDCSGSGGFGIDILTLYDINLRFEYSFNQLGQNGLFLHNQPDFRFIFTGLIKPPGSRL